jgi:hypothetical protein
MNMPNYTAPVVTKIEFLDGMKIKIFFDGKTKVVDIGDSDLPDRFPKLKQKDFFQKALTDVGALAWPDGLHVDLDELVYDFPDVGEKELPATGSFTKRLEAALTKIIKSK